MKKQKLNNKRKLYKLWRDLVKPTNFCVPETIEEFTNVCNKFPPSIKNKNGVELFLTSKGSGVLQRFCTLLCEYSKIQNYVSYSATYSMILTVFQDELCLIDEDTEEAFSVNLIARIIKNLKSEMNTYTFFTCIDGIKLEDIKKFSIVDVECFVFTKKYALGLREKLRNSADKDFDDKVLKKYEKIFNGKLCLETSSFGEHTKAKELAFQKFYHFLRIMRFVLCLSELEREEHRDVFHEHEIKVNILGESYQTPNDILCLNIDKPGTMMMGDRGRKNLQPLRINSFFKEFRKAYFLDDLGAILCKKNKTFLENIIMTALYWISEAQNDFQQESAFVKYCIALETMLLFDDRGGKKQRLANRVPCLLCFVGGYSFIELEDIYDTYVAVRKLYSKRSKIVHEGDAVQIGSLDVKSACKYAARCLAVLLYLRTQNYETEEHLERQLKRLYRNILISRKQALITNLASDRKWKKIVDSSLSVPRVFKGNGDIKLIIIGQDPVIKNESNRKHITTVLNLDKPNNVLYRYIDRICTSLGISVEENVYATNLIQNFCYEQPGKMGNSVLLKRLYKKWSPLLQDELAQFPKVPIIVLGDLALQLFLEDERAKLREYWGWCRSWESKKEYNKLSYELKEGRMIFPFPHQRTICRKFYAHRFDEYSNFLQQHL